MVSKNFKKLKTLPVSLICATYNRPKELKILINSIKKNLYWPKEVIIVGTRSSDFENIDKKNYKFKIKTFISKKKNQIFQRNLGIKKSKFPIVIQCDDDLKLDRNFIKSFYENFKENINVKKIIGANILNTKKQKQSERWNKLYNKSLIFRTILYFLNRFKKIKYMSLIDSGRIAPLIPIDIKNKKNYKLDQLQWLNSTLCYNKKIIKKINIKKIYGNKKSYFEDVFFTHYNYLKGFNLIIDNNVIAYHETTLPTNFKTHYLTIPIQWKLVKFFNKSKFLFLIDILIFSFAYLLYDFLKFLFKK